MALLMDLSVALSVPRPTRALVDLGALYRNYERAAALAAPAEAVAVVKANGYGHGLAAVAKCLQGVAPMFAVAMLEEAQMLRAVVADTPILLMQGIHDPADWRLCGPLKAIAVVHSEEQIDALTTAPLTESTPIWIKINTGMNRLGFLPELVDAAIARLESVPQVTVTGLMTHFACADDPQSAETAVQVDKVEQVRARYGHLSLSIANSAGHYTSNPRGSDWSRPGIMLYGGAPLIDSRGCDLGLEPVMTLESQLIAVRTLAPGEAVGYGATWRVGPNGGRMGVVAIGYADGYPRHAPTGTPVAVNGKRAALLGRVSMDMLAVDLSDQPYAKVGDPVELWGATISVDDVARAAGSISYELLTGVTARVPRVYR